MSIFAIFKSPLPSFTYIYKGGRTAVFIGGRYMTDEEALIREMFDEVGEVGAAKSRHPYIYVDPDESQIDSEAPSPIELIKIKAREEAREELLKEQEEARNRAMNATANTSTTAKQDFASSVGNSNTIATPGDSNSAPEGVGIVPAGGATGGAKAVALNLPKK